MLAISSGEKMADRFAAAFATAGSGADVLPLKLASPEYTASLGRASAADAAPLSQALRRQLGLRLDQANSTIQRFVIEHADSNHDEDNSACRANAAKRFDRYFHCCSQGFRVPFNLMPVGAIWRSITARPRWGREHAGGNQQEFRPVAHQRIVPTPPIAS